MKLDVLAFGAHPDDVELSCSGTLYKLKKAGKKVGIIDLTRGELGTRGTAEIRSQESSLSSTILNLDARENLDIGDGWFEINAKNKMKVIEVLRKYQPNIVLANAITDRHIDHPRAAQLVKESVFLSGLKKIETSIDGVNQEPWRPKHLFHYIQYYHCNPDFVIDISEEFSVKLESIKAYKTQFFDPSSKSTEPQTPISSERFLKSVEARSREFGTIVNAEYGEGFTCDTPLSYDFLTLL